MKHTVRILSVLLAFCLLVAPLGGCASQSRPLIYLKSAVERSLEKSIGGEMAALLAEALAGGSISLSWQGEEALGGVTDVDATVYFDAENSKIISDTALSIGEQTYDAKLWLSDEAVVAVSDAFFGSTTLGVDLDTLEDDLKHSIFRNNSGTAYAVPEIGERSANAVLTLVEGFFSLYTSADDIAELLDKHFESFLKYLTEHARYTRYSEDGKVHIYLLVDNSTLARVLRDTWTKAVADKALCRRVREVAKTHDAMVSATAGIVSTEWTAIAENWLVNNAEIEALCAELDAAEPFTLEVNAAVKKLTGTLDTLAVSYRSGERSADLTLDLSQKDALFLSVAYGGVKHSLALQTIKEGWSAYAADFTYTQTGAEGTEAAWQGRIELDKKQDTYLLSLTQGDRTRELRGTFFCNGDGFSLSVDSLFEGERQIDFSCMLAVAARAKLPALPQYVNLPTVTEQRIDPVAARVRETYAALDAALDTDAFTWDRVVAHLLAPLKFEA